MNLRQLEYLVAVVDEGSFTRAAERLLVAQPSLSQQIRALEAEVGGPLLERLPRGVKPTAAGLVFLPEARAAVQAARRAAVAARGALGLEHGELEIATVSSIAVGILPDVIAQWRAAHPQTAIRLREFSHRHVLAEEVRHGAGDLGVGPAPAGWGGPVQTLGWEEFVIVLAPDDPLAAGGRPLALEDLSDRSWVLFERDHGLSVVATHACGQAGFEPRASVRTRQVEAAARLAAAGMGPTLVPGNAVPPGLPATIRRLRRPVGRELVAFTRTAWSPAAEAFVDLLRARAWQPSPEDALTVP